MIKAIGDPCSRACLTTTIQAPTSGELRVSYAIVDGFRRYQRDLSFLNKGTIRGSATFLRGLNGLPIVRFPITSSNVSIRRAEEVLAYIIFTTVPLTNLRRITTTRQATSCGLLF